MNTILSTNELYRIAKDEVIMMSLSGGTIETIKEEGWHLFKGVTSPMSKIKKLTEREALQMIIDSYKKACDVRAYDYEIYSVHDINTHNEVEHMLGIINAN